MSFAGKYILVANHEADVVSLVAQNLMGAGFEVIKAYDGQDALDKAKRIHPSLVVLDLDMPKLSGTEVLRSLKSDAQTSRICVVILTSRKEEVDRIVSLELGADDYVTKPFSVRELTLRVKSILTRTTFTSPTPMQKFIRCGAITLDRDAHEVRVGETNIELTAVEFKLLSALLRQPGRVFSREDILDAVWGAESDVEIRTVDTHLRRLRKKLGDASNQINTVRGFGYRLDER